jgi:hypothetical protein
VALRPSKWLGPLKSDHPSPLVATEPKEDF